MSKPRAKSSNSGNPGNQGNQGNQGIVVAPQCEAAREGASVLREGGNAADALVTAALVQGVTDPHRCGLGGFGCATIRWQESSESLCVGFHARGGEKVHAEQWESILESAAPDGFGYILKGKVNDVGYQSIATPGMVAGLAVIHSRFGHLPWKNLVQRAARVARTGFLVGPGLAGFWRRPGLYGRVSTGDRLGQTEYGKELWLDENGTPFQEGHVVVQEDLAQTYDQLAAEGPESFYTGALGARIAADLQGNGAWVTEEDMRHCQAVEEAPLVGHFRDHEVLTSPLPGGGTALLQALKLVEHEGFERLRFNSLEYIDRLARILKAVWHDRLENQGDPLFTSARSDDLLADNYINELLEKHGHAPVSGSESPDTTQLSIVDAQHNCISFSHSLGYGSGVFTPKLGFMFNNCMSGFDPRPGKANSIAPGKARSTAIAETILLHKGKPSLVLGSPGAARITAAIVQVLVGVIDHGMSLSEAILQPRFDAYGERTLFLESRFPLDIVRALEKRGWEVRQSPRPFGMVGRVYAIRIHPDGHVEGGVDPGEPGLSQRA